MRCRVISDVPYLVAVVLAAGFAVIAVLTLLVVLGKHSGKDLGSVSARWIAEHRVDAA